MPDTYTSQFSGEEIDSALRAAQILSGADTPAELRDKLEIRGDTIPVSATDPTPVSEALTASGGGVNPNLLDNWYFGRPVNQRRQTEYTESWKYGIDRWLCAGDGKVTIADGHCVFYGAVDQGLSVQMSDIESKILTASLLFADGSLLSESAVDTNQSIDIPFWSNIKDTYCGLNATDLSGHRRFRLYFNKNTPILAAKLELGDTQTLAHQDSSGNWILNEIPDSGEQLRRCQYYAFKPVNVKDYGRIASGIGMSGNLIAFNIPIPHMRNVAPVVTGIGNTCTFWDGMSIQSGTISSLNGTSNEYITLLVSSTSFSVTAGTPFHLLTADILISADL